MQNTSPGPEGKEREGRRKRRQRTEYECRHFPRWPIVCRVSVLETGTCLAERAGRVFTEPLLAGAEAARGNTEGNQGGLRCVAGGVASGRQSRLHGGLAGSCPLCRTALDAVRRAARRRAARRGTSAAAACLPAPASPPTEHPAGHPACLQRTILELKTTSL